MEHRLKFIQQRNNISQLKSTINEKGLRVKFKLAYLVYDTIFDEWNKLFLMPEESFCFLRKEIMKKSGIGNTGTYKACINQLIGLGLIEYKYGGKSAAIFSINRVDFNEKVEGEQEKKATFFEKAMAYVEAESRKKTKTPEEHEATETVKNTVKTVETAKTVAKNEPKISQKEKVVAKNEPKVSQKENTVAKNEPEVSQKPAENNARIVYKAINKGRESIGLQKLTRANAQTDEGYCRKIALFFEEKYPNNTEQAIYEVIESYASVCSPYEKQRFMPSWIGQGSRTEEINDKAILYLKQHKKPDKQIKRNQADLAMIHSKIQSVIQYAFGRTDLESREDVNSYLLEIARLGTYDDFDSFISQYINKATDTQKHCFNTQNAYNEYKQWLNIS